MARRKSTNAPDMVEQILAGAERAFLATGYDLTTMDIVARYAEVARASVYNNFASKEALFLLVMRRGISRFVARATSGDDPTLPPFIRLRKVAVGFVKTAIEPAEIGMYRVVISQVPRFPELGNTLREQGRPGVEAKFRSIAMLIENGLTIDPAQFATALFNQLMGGCISQHLLGVTDFPTPAEIEEEVDRALASLLPSGVRFADVTV